MSSGNDTPEALDEFASPENTSTDGLPALTEEAAARMPDGQQTDVTESIDLDPELAEPPSTASPEQPPTCETDESISRVAELGELLRSETIDPPAWKYRLETTDHPHGVVHILENHSGDRSFKINPVDDSYYVYEYETRTPDASERAQTKEFSSFAHAFCAVVEAVDWGSLPPGESPDIWSYEGYRGIEEDGSFPEYLAECGGHYLRNESADYGISITTTEVADGDSYQTHFEITTQAEQDQGKTTFDDEFPGQHYAFCELIGVLSMGVSATIYEFDMTSDEDSEQLVVMPDPDSATQKAAKHPRR